MELQCQRERLAVLLAGSIFFVVQWKVLWNRSITDYSKVMSSIRNLAPIITDNWQMPKGAFGQEGCGAV